MQNMNLFHKRKQKNQENDFKILRVTDITFQIIQGSIGNIFTYAYVFLKCMATI